VPKELRDSICKQILGVATSHQRPWFAGAEPGLGQHPAQVHDDPSRRHKIRRPAWIGARSHQNFSRLHAFIGVRPQDHTCTARGYFTSDLLSTDSNVSCFANSVRKAPTQRMQVPCQIRDNPVCRIRPSSLTRAITLPFSVRNPRLARSSRFIAQEPFGTSISGPGTDWKKRQRRNPVSARALCACAQPGRIGKSEWNRNSTYSKMQNPDDLRIQQQKEMARGIADLLARLHPEAQPLLRLHLAHWLARRVTENRAARAGAAGQTGQPQPTPTDTPLSDYEI